MRNPNRQHQSGWTMPRLAVNRKDTGGESLDGKVPCLLSISARNP